MEDQDEELLRIRTILRENPRGLTIEEIAKKLPLNRTSTAKYLNTLLISGQAEMRTFGRAKVFTLSQRVPFSQMLNLSSDLLMVLDHELTINQVNESLLKTFNLQKESLVGVKIDNSLLVPFLSEKNLDMIRESSKGNEITKLDRIEISGKEYFFRIKMIPVVFDQGGQGLAVVLEDITELKQYQQHLEQLVEERTRELSATNEKLLEEIRERQKSQAALEQGERKYRELVENANSIILRVNEKGAIIFFNEFAEKFFGTTEAEMLGKNIIGTIIATTVPPDKTPADLAREFLTPTESMTYNEVACTDKRGEQAWVAWTIRPVVDSGGVLNEYLIVGMDITERKNVENALHRINTKLNLVSSIARHDILNKITVISTVITLLKETCKDKTQSGYLERAERALLAIKNQIIFTRDFKDMGMKKAYWQALGDVLLQARGELELGSISLTVPENGVELFADPWLKKVFTNLFDNVIRHAGPATKITVNYQESADGLEIVIQDNGVGIPPDEKEKIFERGFGKDHGYGLFLVTEILAITGLSIKENGEAGKGARFVITVPKRSYRYKH